MTVWVVNASPLILLGKIDRLHLLAKLAAQVVIPHEVVIEIGAGTSWCRPWLFDSPGGWR